MQRTNHSQCRCVGFASPRRTSRIFGRCTSGPCVRRKGGPQGRKGSVSPLALRRRRSITQALAVFEIIPYSLTHYSLYSVHDIVNYIGNEQTRIRTLRWSFLNVICVSKCAGYSCDADGCAHIKLTNRALMRKAGGCIDDVECYIFYVKSQING